MPRMTSVMPERPMARCASAIRVRVPPSPLLSARRRSSTYFSVTMMISAQRISDRTPSTASRLSARAAMGGGMQRLAEGIERAGADIAIDDADRTDGEAPETGRGCASRRCRPWPLRSCYAPSGVSGGRTGFAGRRADRIGRLCCTAARPAAIYTVPASGARARAMRCGLGCRAARAGSGALHGRRRTSRRHLKPATHSDKPLLAQVAR